VDIDFASYEILLARTKKTKENGECLGERPLDPCWRTVGGNPNRRYDQTGPAAGSYFLLCGEPERGMTY